MATRHDARIAAVQILYSSDIGNDKALKYMDEVLEDKKIRNKQREFAIELVNNVLAAQEKLDETINVFLKDWDLDHIGAVDRAILRLGAYELLNTTIDKAVIINEMVEIAKNFSNDNSPKLINGVLDALGKTK